MKTSINILIDFYASKMFNKSIKSVTKAERNYAKIIYIFSKQENKAFCNICLN